MKNKLFLVLFLLGFVFGIEGVNARIITIDEVNDKVKTDFIDVLNEYSEGDDNLSSSVNNDNATLDFYLGSSKIVSINYTDEYIEYDNRDAVISEQTVNEDVLQTLCLFSVIQSILDLSGKSDMEISDDIISNSNLYDEYGIEIISESYDYSGSDGDSSWSTSGEYIKYLKFTLDTDKIDALFDTYGVESSDGGYGSAIMSNLAPVIEVSDIDTNMILVKGYMVDINIDMDDELYCDLYRSEDQNGVYELIDENENCLNGFTYTDSGLNSGTTYFYKAKLKDSSKFSNIIRVTTLDNNVNSDSYSYNDDIYVNPDTGNGTTIVTILLLSISSLFMGLFLYKKFISYM